MNEFNTSLFEILGNLPENATPEEINKAYKLLAQLYHPDKNPNRPEWAVENMKRLNRAKEILSDPKRREQYLRLLKAKSQEEQYRKNNEEKLKQENLQLKKRMTQREQQIENGVSAAFGLGLLLLVIAAFEN
jgi:curved DNA-binding protein CbpA